MDQNKSKCPFFQSLHQFDAGNRRINGNWQIYQRAAGAAGLNLVAVARNQSKLEILKNDLETKYHIQVKTISEDLSKPETSVEIAEQTVDIDIALCHAPGRLNCLGF